MRKMIIIATMVMSTMLAGCESYMPMSASHIETAVEAEEGEISFSGVDIPQEDIPYMAYLGKQLDPRTADLAPKYQRYFYYYCDLETQVMYVTEGGVDTLTPLYNPDGSLRIACK